MTVVAMVAVYVLSYAPVVRYCIPPPVRGFEKPPVITVAIYRPVEWLIDYTPAKTPLLWWADLWGVWHPTYSFSVYREIERDLHEEVNPNP